MTFLPGRGLDVGTSTLIASRYKEDGSIVHSRIRDAFIDIEKTNETMQSLNSLKVDYIEHEKSLLVLGDDALTLAASLKREVRRPMVKGVLSNQDPLAQDIMFDLLKSILGEPIKPGEVVFFTVPALPIGVDASEFDTQYHELTISDILTDMGYTPHPVNEGLCVVYAGLKEAKWTGIGISFGAGLTNVCYATLGIEADRFAVNKGGDWIDNAAAKRKFNTPVSRVTKIKESKVNQVHLIRDYGAKDVIRDALTKAYRMLMEDVCFTLCKSMEAKGEIDEAVNIAIAGGGALIPGFKEAFEECLKRFSPTFQINKINVLEEPLYAISTGALARARVEES